MEGPLSFSPCGRSVKNFRLKCRVPEEAWRFVCRQTDVPQAQKQVLSLEAFLFWVDVVEALDAWKEKERLRERENEGKIERGRDKEGRELESEDTRRQVLKLVETQ